ncbi:HAMP domain-containing protein [Massilia arenosa]|uniref:Oxygen sensor histidine kinase NreB n=1 Tax=Zemynaea arenosa TaxID=2561931 RepID=A0A4Y9SMP6_9BURK|nr:ATP-binding protein [Massilia arenosa]TFW25778.1 HAMP domain-containing protein [Massilia arenosa]
MTPFWTGWSIGKRMIVIAMLPVAYLFCSIVWYSWFSHRAQVSEELAERGRILARALAETSEYNVISGNLTDLRLTINGLVQSDKSIYRIDVVDANRREVVGVSAEGGRDAEERVFEAPIRKQMIWVNLFSENGAPHVSGSSDARPPTMTMEVVGYVRVTMSPSNLMDKQIARFQVELVMAALALLVSGALALLLARSLAMPLKTAIDALRQIRSGNYLVKVDVTTGGEVGELQSSIAEMSVALNEAKQDLENKVAERTRDLEESRNQAVRADAEKRKLIHKVNSIVEDERKSIAIEIHDELNASLIAARLESQAIMRLAEKMEPGPQIDEIKQKSAAITKLTLDLYASGRRLVRRLRPEVLDMLGLDGAVEEMTRHYNNGDCQFEFHAEGDFSRVEGEVAISAYRIVQEALSNIMKHATASRASVTMTLGEEELDIAIRDNGAGFDTGRASEGIGIIGMRERVVAMGGAMKIDSSAESGTEVNITLPLAVS